MLSFAVFWGRLRASVSGMAEEENTVLLCMRRCLEVALQSLA